MISECRVRCGDRHTGYLLRAVTSGTGAGPVLEEGIAVSFARASRPRGRPTAERGRASTDQLSEMEEAFRLAGNPEFRRKPEFVEFQAALAESIENGNVWPVVDEESQTRR